MNKLSWILLLIIFLGAIVDALLVYIYMRFAHPWKDILFYKDKTSKEEENEIVDQGREKQEREEEVAPETSPTLNQEGDFTDDNFFTFRLLTLSKLGCVGLYICCYNKSYPCLVSWNMVKVKNFKYALNSN